MGGKAAWSPGSYRSAGVAVLFHPQRAAKLIDFKSDLSGRVVTIKVERDGNSFKLINVSAPNNHLDRKDFFDFLWHYSFHNLHAIVAGDFNCMPDAALDKWGDDDRFGTKAVTQVHSFTNSMSLEDFYHISNPSGRLFTWFNGLHLVGFRLDWFSTPRAWRLQVSAHTCTALAYSDHHMISLKLSL